MTRVTTTTARLIGAAARASRAARLAAAAAATLLAACGGGDGGGVTGPGGNGPAASSYAGRSAGGLAHTVTGVAYYFAEAGAGDEGGLALAMGSLNADSTFRDVVAIGRRNHALPAPGTYALYDFGSDAEPSADAFALVAGMEPPGREKVLCFATGGTLTVRSTSGGRVKGSYTAEASCLDPEAEDGETTVTLTGTFDAVQHAPVGDGLPGEMSPAAGFARAARAARAASR